MRSPTDEKFHLVGTQTTWLIETAIFAEYGTFLRASRFLARNGAVL
jgi:hypothetical protein